MPQSDADNGVDVLHALFTEAADAAEVFARECRKVTRKSIVDSAIAADDIVGKELLVVMVQQSSDVLEDVTLRMLLSTLICFNWSYVDEASEQQLVEFKKRYADKFDSVPRAPFEL